MIDPGPSKVPRTMPGGLGIGKRASRESEEPGKACTFPEVRRRLGWGWCKVLSWGQQKRKLDRGTRATLKAYKARAGSGFWKVFGGMCSITSSVPALVPELFYNLQLARAPFQALVWAGSPTQHSLCLPSRCCWSSWEARCVCR